MSLVILLTQRKRLLDAQAHLEETSNREATLQRLLNETRDLLAADRHDEALILANRALALDPSNTEALRCTAKVYATLSASLFDTDDAPPVILVDEINRATPNAEGVLTVRSPELIVSGTVFDNSPIEIRLLESKLGTLEQVDQREMLGTWITSFRASLTLPTGQSTITVQATDQGGHASKASIIVNHVLPFVRTSWFPATILLIVGVCLSAFFVRRALHGRSLLQRRFNPYIAGAPIFEKQKFFGRRRLLDYVLRRIANNSILLYGERRIGKTSFQHQLKRCLADLDDPSYIFYPVFIDLQGTPQELFFATVSADLFQDLSPFLDGLEPDSLINVGTYGYRELVKDLQRVLRVLGGRSSKKVKIVLLIDEVDELNEYDPRINQKLRSLFMRTFAENLVSVVSGVSIKKQWEREGSPWYNFFQEIEVQALDAEAARAFIEEPVRGVLTFENEVVDEILRRTKCRPYQIQKLCSVLVDSMHEEGLRTISLSDVTNAGHTLESH